MSQWSDGALFLVLLLTGVIGVLVGYGVGFLLGSAHGYTRGVEDGSAKLKRKITAQEILDKIEAERQASQKKRVV